MTEPRRRGKPVLDLTGKDFPWLHVLGRAENSPSGRVQWRCQCSYNGCGNITVVQSRLLRNGSTKSCGCLARETSRRTVQIARAARGRAPRIAPASIR
jgi:hypothetical protein